MITLRRDDAIDWFTALGWTPEGRRARGRPKTTEEQGSGTKTDSFGLRSGRPYALTTGTMKRYDDTSHEYLG